MWIPKPKRTAVPESKKAKIYLQEGTFQFHSLQVSWDFDFESMAKTHFGTSLKKSRTQCHLSWLQVQGVQGQIFMFQFALTDRNMQARFGLKVFWEF